MKEMDRREFFKGTAWMGLAAAAAGCHLDRVFCSGGAPMAGFAAEPIRHVRIGFVGVGERGGHALRRLSQFPGVSVAAICDVDERTLKGHQTFLADKKLPLAKEFLGPVAYKDLCQWDGVDVVYACTPWKLHAPVAIEAMKCGKHAFVEVPATMDIDSCWEIVETSEATRRHCMMLENCCYGEIELLALNMCRLGLLGTPVYGEAGYLHSGSTRGPMSKFRAQWYQEHRGNYYPTHGLGPVAQYMNINRGDRFDYLNSAEGRPIDELVRGGDPRWLGDNFAEYAKFKCGAHSTSLIRTVNGNVIFLDLSSPVPHPYSRINTIQGTHGIIQDYPLRIDIEMEPGSGPRTHGRDEKFTEACRKRFMHPMWRDVGEIAKRIGGHGGMDFIMDLRWVYCLQNGLPLDMDVYDLASWSCICEVTERSEARRGAPEEIPDFTRGGWKTMAPLGVVNVDLDRMGVQNIKSAGPQQTIGESREG